MNEVNVIITNGAISYKFYWLKQTPMGIYHGFRLGSKDGTHWSYHADGKSWCTIKGKKEMKSKLIPLSEIKDVCFLCTVARNFNANIQKDKLLKDSVYKGERLDNIVWLDIRSFPTNSTVNILLHLVRPHFLSTMLSYPRYAKKDKDDFHVIQIVNSINPWLLIHATSFKKAIQRNKEVKI